MDFEGYDQKGTFLSHLEELRRRLIISVVAVLVCAAAGFPLVDPVLRCLTAPAVQHAGGLYFFSPERAFMVKIHTALFLGLVLSLPVVLAQVWLFVAPALYAKERKKFLFIVGAASVLFLSGCAFAFWGVIPTAVGFFMGFGNDFLKPMISVDEYLNFSVTMMLAFGIAFNLPIFMYVLAWLGLVDPRTLGKYRPHAVVGLFVVAALLTPSTDIASQLMLALPLWVLYEISLVMMRFVKKRRKEPGL